MLSFDRFKLRKICLYMVLVATLMGSCATVTPTASPLAEPTALITPFLSPTPTITLPAPTALEVIPVTPEPTATPFSHTIVKGDTMLALAFTYGVKLEDLLAANPQVDPHFLVVGETLVVPIEGGDPATLPTPTPVPVRIVEPNCYSTLDGGVWCFLLVHNDTPHGLENLTAWIGLFDEQGNNLAGQVAAAPLNLLEPGHALPLIAFFPPPIPVALDELHASAELLTALAVADDDQRYLEGSMQVDEVLVEEGDSQAQVSGSVGAPEDSAASGVVWLAAMAYDENGQVVGVRKLELADAIDPGESLPFKIALFSLGGDIAEVEVLLEIRAIGEVIGEESP